MKRREEKNTKIKILKIGITTNGKGIKSIITGYCEQLCQQIRQLTWIGHISKKKDINYWNWFCFQEERECCNVVAIPSK